MTDKKILEFLKRRGYLIEEIDIDSYGCKHPGLSVLFVLNTYEDFIEITVTFEITRYARKNNPELQVFIWNHNSESLVSDFSYDVEYGKVVAIAKLRKPFSEPDLEKLISSWDKHDFELPYSLPNCENLMKHAKKSRRNLGHGPI